MSAPTCTVSTEEEILADQDVADEAEAFGRDLRAAVGGRLEDPRGVPRGP